MEEWTNWENTERYISRFSEVLILDNDCYGNAYDYGVVRRD